MAYQPPDQYTPSSATYPSSDPPNFDVKHPPPPAYQASPYAAQPGPAGGMYIPAPIVVQPLGGFLGHNPSTTQCMTCRQQVITNVQYEIGGMTFLIMFLIFIFGGAFGCCLIPLCVPGCQDAVHTCPACHTILGRKSPL